MGEIKWKDISKKISGSGMIKNIEKYLVDNKDIQKITGYKSKEDIDWNEFVWPDTEEFEKSGTYKDMKKGFSEFLARKAWHESKGFDDRSKVINSLGYIGKYQMGRQALKSVNYFKKGTYEWIGDKSSICTTYIDEWKKEKKLSEHPSSSIDESWVKYFVGNSTLQEEANKKLLLLNWQIIKKKRLDIYIGKTIQGVPITVSGLLAGAHLCGPDSIEAFLKEENVITDGNKTPITKYILRMGDFDLTELLGYNPDNFEVKNMTFLYKIKHGDSIAKVLRKFYGYSKGGRWVNEVKILNNKNELHEGEVLVIPNIPIDKDNKRISYTCFYNEKEIETYNPDIIKESEWDIDLNGLDFKDSSQRKKINVKVKRNKKIKAGEAMPLYHTVKNGRYTDFSKVNIWESLNKKDKVVYEYVGMNSYLADIYPGFDKMESYAQKGINDAEKEKKVILFEKNKSSSECETTKKVSELKEGDLIYLEQSETLLKALVKQLSDSEEISIENIKNYVEERTGKKLDNSNEELMTKMLENFSKLKEGDYSYLVRQENFDILRTLEGKIGFKYLFFYMLSVDKEKKPLKFISSIFEGIEYNEMRDLELGSLKENHEEDKWYKFLKSYEDKDKLKISTNSDYKVARGVLDIVLIRYMEKRFNAKIGRVLENILLEYHKEKVITLHGSNGMYSKVDGLVSSGKVDVFTFITSYDNEEKLTYHIKHMNKALQNIKIRDIDRDYLFYLKRFYEEDNFPIGDDRLNDLDMTMELAKAHGGNRDCISFIESFYDRVGLIRKEARSRGRVIDDVSDALIVEYYGEGESESSIVKSDLIYKVSIDVIKSNNLSVFHLSKAMNPKEIDSQYTMDTSSKQLVNKTWAEYKKLLEKIIKEDFDEYKKEGYVGNNAIAIPSDTFIDDLLKAFPVFSASRKTHFFFKSFRQMTEEQRRQEAQEDADRQQREEWNNLSSNGSVSRALEVDGKVIACIDGEWGYYSKQAYNEHIGRAR